MKPRTHFSIHREDFDRFYSLKGWKRLDDNQVAAMQPVTLTTHKWNDAPPCPAAMELTKEECQSLIDALWDAGIRPSAGQGSAGQLAAVQDHLNDTRSLLTKVTDALIEQLPKKRP